MSDTRGSADTSVEKNAPDDLAKGKNNRGATPVISILEDTYPDASQLLKSAAVPDAAADEVLIVLDTNALLLPYQVGTHDLGEIAAAYGKISAARRLFVPARALREFINNRDRNLADVLKSLLDEKSTLRLPQNSVPRSFENVDGYQELIATSESLKAYHQAVTRVVDGVKAWRGNDPVTLLYCSLFSIENIVEVDDDWDSLESEWERRLKHKIPPGYKDQSKPDKGVGDFLIWKSLLKLGRVSKKDLIFVTGEEKSDWWVKSGNATLFPRPELIVEYRAASDGHNLRIASLSQLLAELKAQEGVVTEIREAEKAKTEAMYVAVHDFLGVNAYQRQRLEREMADLAKQRFTRDAHLFALTDGRRSIPRYFGDAPEGTAKYAEYRSKMERADSEIDAVRAFNQAEDIKAQVRLNELADQLDKLGGPLSRD